jgi:hypothetical protein
MLVTRAGRGVRSIACEQLRLMVEPRPHIDDLQASRSVLHPLDSLGTQVYTTVVFHKRVLTVRVSSTNSASCLAR